MEGEMQEITPLEDEWKTGVDTRANCER